DLDYLYREGRILVRDIDLPRVRAVVGGEVVDSLINGVTALVPDRDAPSALDEIDRVLGVGVAAPDHVLYVTPAGCCPATEPHTVVHRTPDPDVRRDSPGDGADTLISVVDTGYITKLDNAGHPWLAGVTGDEESFKATDIGPYVGHGTFVAGVLRCMAPRAEVRVEGFLTHGGAIYESEIIRQLNDAIESVPDIISISAGCTTRHNLVPLAFEAFWEHRLKHCKGTVLVAAAGNDGSRRQFFPASCEWAVSVGALDRHGRRAPFSNYGSWVDVYALGVDVVNAYPNGRFRYREPEKVGQVAKFINEMANWSGTSFSTPLVAGMIAARMSHTGQNGRQAADSILRIARSHARPGVGAVAEPGMACDQDPGCSAR
ncbi:MAG TPA: S8 family serine peptidase, partial [Jatrophihabitans sp.]|nr:S8 family serine peptidase [Jatrophihabitans sp.]